MPTARQSTDLVAERLLLTVLRLESAPWPAALRAYGAALLALAIRCERPSAKAEVYRWFLREAGGALRDRHESRRECLRDAFHDTIARMPGILMRCRAALDPARRPNLRSMLVAAIRWRANGLHRSVHGRHDTRRAPYIGDDRRAAGTPDLVVEMREVLALVSGADPRYRALLLVGAGHTVAEAARLTGVSRQTIYRMRDLLREIVSDR